MTVRIRLKRLGRRNRPSHRLCAVDMRAKRDGRVLENLGLYDPLAPRVEDQLRLHGERIQYWLSHGASLSETAVSLCRRAGIAIPERGKKKPRRNRKTTEARAKAKFERKARIHKAKRARREARVAADSAGKKTGEKEA